MREFAEKHSPGLWETLLKALTGDCGVLTSEQADLQKRRIVALLHILAYFRQVKKIIFQQNPPKKVLVLIKDIQYHKFPHPQNKDYQKWDAYLVNNDNDNKYYCNNIKIIIKIILHL